MSTPLDGVWTPISEAVHQPPVWVIKDMLPSGLTFIAGPPKSEKSTLLMALCCAVADVECRALPPHLRKVSNGGTVMGLSGEATAGELRYMVEKGMKCALPDDDGIVIANNPYDFMLDDDVARASLLTWLEERRPRVFFGDPLRNLHSMEEKDDGAMNRLVHPFQQWAKANDSACVFVHHTKKKSVKQDGDYDATDMRGTTALFGAADGIIVVTPRGKGVLHLKATFKRGESWERDIRLGVWGQETEDLTLSAEEASDAAVPTHAIPVLRAYVRHGVSLTKAANTLRMKRDTILQHTMTLEKCGALMRDDRGNLQVTALARTLVRGDT